MNDPKIEYGEHLGQIIDEIASEYGNEASIEEFVTCRPKNYAYEVRLLSGQIKTLTKTKGITLNTLTMQMIDYKFMLEAVKKYANRGEYGELVRVSQFNILSDSHHNVHTKY